MIHFFVEMQDLTEIEKALGMQKDKSKMVLRSAINQTAKETKKLLVDEANREYFIAKGKVSKTLSIKKATTGHMEGIVQSVGPVNELYDFKVRPKGYNPSARPRAGHTGNVKRINPPKRLYLMPGNSDDKYKAFTVQFKNEHKSIAQRVPGTHMRDKPWKEGIKNLYSTSTPSMLGYEKGVFGVVEPQMYDMLQRNIQEQILRYTS